jgi:hypothetical protein
MFNSDTFANRPAFGIVGRIFISTDTKEFFRDTGTSWELIGGPGSGTITGSGAAGQVTYFTGATSVAGSNNLFWDATNNRLGIGTITPDYDIEIKKNGFNNINVKSLNSGVVSYRLESNVDSAAFQCGNAFGFGNGAGIGTFNSVPFIVVTNSNANLKIFPNGNALFQTGGSLTDNGQRLQVVGDALINFVNQYTAITATDGLFLKCPSTSANGVIGLTGSGMILQGRDGTSTAYPVIMQPYGSNVLIGTIVNTGYKVQITTTNADSHLNVWGASAPSIRLDNAASGATQRFVIGLATGTNQFIQGAAANDVCLATQSVSPLLFGMWNGTNASEVMRLSTANNLLVGTSTDVGAKLRVNGDISCAVDLRLSRTSASPAIITDQQAIRLVNQTASETITLNIENNGIRFGGYIRTNTVLGSNPDYKFGAYNAVAPLATGYLNIEVGGVVYKVLAST